MFVEEKLKEYKTPLNYEGFEEYRIKNNTDYVGNGWSDKQQWIFRFENGYGASIIKHYGSYGWEEDLFELAVLIFEDNEFDLCYSTPITDDVIGHLTNNDVIRYLNKIKRLK